MMSDLVCCPDDDEPKKVPVKPSFSHGRSKTVVVETKRRRIIVDRLAPSPIRE